MKTGWIVEINNSTFAITDMLKLDGGTNNLAILKSTVLVFNDQLFFTLHKNNTVGIVATLNVLTSSSLITLTNYTHTKSEN